MSEELAVLELTNALKVNDWYFDYSDDIRVYRSGKASEERIKVLMSKCDPTKAKELWNKYCPEGFKKL